MLLQEAEDALALLEKNDCEPAAAITAAAAEVAAEAEGMALEAEAEAQPLVAEAEKKRAAHESKVAGAEAARQDVEDKIALVEAAEQRSASATAARQAAENAAAAAASRERMAELENADRSESAWALARAQARTELAKQTAMRETRRRLAEYRNAVSERQRKDEAMVEERYIHRAQVECDGLASRFLMLAPFRILPLTLSLCVSPSPFHRSRLSSASPVAPLPTTWPSKTLLSPRPVHAAATDLPPPPLSVPPCPPSWASTARLASSADSPPSAAPTRPLAPPPRGSHHPGATRSAARAPLRDQPR